VVWTRCSGAFGGGCRSRDVGGSVEVPCVTAVRHCSSSLRSALTPASVGTGEDTGLRRTSAEIPLPSCEPSAPCPAAGRAVGAHRTTRVEDLRHCAASRRAMQAPIANRYPARPPAVGCTSTPPIPHLVVRQSSSPVERAMVHRTRGVVRPRSTACPPPPRPAARANPFRCARSPHTRCGRVARAVVGR
jgi:hypothetical protein